MDKAFWSIINIDLKPHQSIETLVNFKDTIILGGAIYQNGLTDGKTAKPFLKFSFDRGKHWIEKNDFDCSVIKDVKYVGGILFITGSKYLGDTSLGSKTIYYKYDIQENGITEINLPDGKEGTMVQTINRSTYLVNVSKNQFGNTYLKTTDGGNTWTEHTVLMKVKQDSYKEIYLQGNEMWGVRTHNKLSDVPDDKDFQTLISIDINTWQINAQIPLGKTARDGKGHTLNTHWIAAIGSIGETLYLLGEDQITGVGYIWKMNINDKEIKVQDDFELTEKQIPSELFIHKDTLIVTYTDVSTFLSAHVLLYKNLSEKSWCKETFPDLTYPFRSFSDGVLMGLNQGNKIYYKQF